MADKRVQKRRQYGGGSSPKAKRPLYSSAATKFITSEEDFHNSLDEQKCVFLSHHPLIESVMSNGEYEVFNLDHFVSPFEEKIRKMQLTLKGEPEITKADFHNWAETQTSRNVYKCQPRNLSEIQSLVKKCNEERVRVRCAGAGHSWAPIFPDDDSVLVYMDKMEGYGDGKKVKFSDHDKTWVDIMTGATTGDFKKFQLDNQVNIPCNVILQVVQMVSVVATGCHGVGKDCLSPGDYVQRMRIVDSSGELKTYTKQDNSDPMKAVSANFGLFGIIYDITIKTEDQICVSMENRYLKIGDLFYGDNNSFKDLVDKNWSIEIFWFPFGSYRKLFKYRPENDKVLVRVINKIKPSEHVLEDEEFYTKQEKNDALTANMQGIVNKIMVANPSLTPGLCKIGYRTIEKRMYPEGTIYQELPQAIHFRKHIHDNPVYDLEFAFDMKNNDFDVIKDIVKVVTEKIKEEAGSSKYPLNIAMEMRFMAYSESYLCPAKIGDPARRYKRGSGNVFYIEILSTTKTRRWKAFSTAVAKQWFDLGGIPHFAKQWPDLPESYDIVRKVLRPEIEQFRKKLEESGADPNGIFLNEHLEKLIFDR